MTCVARVYGAFTAAVALTVGPLFVLHPRGRRRLGERFGGWNLPPHEFVWFHGASLGEMNGLLPLMRRWKGDFPAIPILATATSTTGLERAAEVADEIRLVPFDNRFLLERALRKCRIKGFIFGETEIWPSLIGTLTARGVPLVMVNARIGEDSLRRYTRFKSLFRGAFDALTAVYANSASDRDRLLACGVRAERCQVLGNAKYDLALAEPSPHRREELRAHLAAAGRPVIVLGSLRPGEEKVWFPVLQRFKGADLVVVVAPRHPEKFDLFAKELGVHDLPFRRWSTPQSQPPAHGLDVVLLDTLGELRDVYGVATLAFVGGSLVDWGGHNPLEPALSGVPVATGPYTSSVDEIAQALDAVGARIPLEGCESTEALVDRVVRGDAELTACGERGREVALRFTGSGEQIYRQIRVVLGEGEGARGT